MKKFLKFIIWAVVIYAVFSANLALAVTCEVLHVNFSGQCVLATDNCPSDKQAIDNSRTDLCLPGQKCCYKTVADSATDLKPVSDENIQLQIPLFDFSEATSLVQYIAKIYEYILIILVPLTIIMIIWGGIQWVIAAGDAGKITAAKKQIIQAFVGLFIGLFSYVILSLVGITQLNMPGLQKIVREEGGDLFLAEPANYSISVPGNLFCPKSGGTAVLPQIANGGIGKITYRMLGKPWDQTPPFADKDNFICDGQPCKSFCPSGQLCLDCSGFMSYLYLCAGLKPLDSFTGTIFAKANCEKISSSTATSINGIELKAGDLVGYPPGSCAEVGHVLIYIGNGNIAESHGGGDTSNSNSGRISGKAIKISPFQDWVKSHASCGCVNRIKQTALLGGSDCKIIKEGEQMPFKTTKPCISADAIKQILSAAGSPIADKAQTFFDMGVKYGIDPAIALAFFKKESNYGQSVGCNVPSITKNPGNIKISPSRCTEQWYNNDPTKCTSDSIADLQERGFCKFSTWEEGIEAWYKAISNSPYIADGKTTVDSVFPTYAPVTEYPAQVKQWVNAWRTQYGDAK